MEIQKLLFSLKEALSNFVGRLSVPFFYIDPTSLQGKRAITGLLPIIGYLLLIVSLADFLHILFPLQLQNPDWELQTIGALVEQCWLFLIALALIFTRYFLDNQEPIREIDLIAIRWIRWIVLILAIFFLLSIPLVIVNTKRLSTFIQQQSDLAQSNQLAQIAQIETQLAQTSEPKTVMEFGKSIGMDVEKLGNASLEELKSAVQQKLTNVETNITKQIKTAQKEQRQKLFKKNFRTVYSIIIVSVGFIVIFVEIGNLH